MQLTRLVCALSIGILASCGGGSSGGGGGGSGFNLMTTAPTGSGAAAVEVRKVNFKGQIARDLVLAPGLAVAGLVRDGAGAALPGVTVSFTARERGSVATSGATDGSGIYTLDLGEGEWIATVDSGDPNLGVLRETVTVGTVPVTQNFQFPMEIVASGIVFDSANMGIDGASLTFVGETTGVTVNAVADGFGFYTATLMPDEYEVVVDPGLNGPNELKERFEDVQVQATGTVHFGLTEGVMLSGMLLNDIGGPLTEAVSIDAILDEDSPFFAPATALSSAVDGSYTFGPLPAGSVELLFAPPADSGYPRQSQQLAVVGPTAQTEDPMLASGVQVTGTILWDDGMTAAAAASILAVPESSGVVAPEAVLTDGAGFYQVSLFPGDYELQIVPNDPADLQLPERRALALPAGGAVAVNLNLTPGVLVTGNVSDAGGGQQDILVEIEGVLGAKAVTDGAGDYTFLAPAGTHDLAVSGVDGTYEFIELAAEAGVVVAGPGPVMQDITLTRSMVGRTVMQGTVFEPDGTTPAVGAILTARSNKTGAILGQSASDATGQYVLVLPEGAR